MRWPRYLRSQRESTERSPRAPRKGRRADGRRRGAPGKDRGIAREAPDGAVDAEEELPQGFGTLNDATVRSSAGRRSTSVPSRSAMVEMT